MGVKGAHRGGVGVDIEEGGASRPKTGAADGWRRTAKPQVPVPAVNGVCAAPSALLPLRMCRSCPCESVVL
eukprot:scaffold10856_cov100-Isochrysis_galbana.AAC.4